MNNEEDVSSYKYRCYLDRDDSGRVYLSLIKPEASLSRRKELRRLEYIINTYLNTSKEDRKNVLDVYEIEKLKDYYNKTSFDDDLLRLTLISIITEQSHKLLDGVTSKDICDLVIKELRYRESLDEYTYKYYRYIIHILLRITDFISKDDKSIIKKSLTEYLVSKDKEYVSEDTYILLYSIRLNNPGRLIDYTYSDQLIDKLSRFDPRYVEESYSYYINDCRDTDNEKFKSIFDIVLYNLFLNHYKKCSYLELDSNLSDLEEIVYHYKNIINQEEGSNLINDIKSRINSTDLSKENNVYQFSIDVEIPFQLPVFKPLEVVLNTPCIEKDRLLSRIEQDEINDPLSDLNLYSDSRGRINNPSKDNDVLYTKIKERMEYACYVISCSFKDSIKPFIDREEDVYPLEKIVNKVLENEFIKTDDFYYLSVKIHSFLNGDFINSSYDLVEMFESVMRGFLDYYGKHNISKNNGKGDYIGLNNIFNSNIEKNIYYRSIVEYFGEDFFFTCSMLFYEDNGFNIRNNISHRTCESTYYESPEVLYACLIILRVILEPSKLLKDKKK